MQLAGMRLDQALAKLAPEFSRNRLQSWISEEKVRMDGKACRAKQKVWGGESVEIEAYSDVIETPDLPEEIALHVVFEDDCLIVIDKPAGLVVHPGSGNREGTLLNALLHHAPILSSIPRAGIVHRLDKETSGLLVVAKTLPAQTSLVRQLQDRSVKRQYVALVHGFVEKDGTVDAPVGRHPAHRTKMAVVGTGKAARTHYHVLKTFSGCTLLECMLESGRTHQIRVHMQHIGHPL
ncbi:MAG TPA: RluA family pseudouridine synthase, partial [Burkholderiales bacterium]|nr:RluA family pseudouridine synthase [Burkholderiales bacterium]